MEYLIGTDVGTSSTKTLLCTTKGKIVAEASHAYPLYSPRPGWNEQDPADWWSGVVKTIRSVLRKAKVKKGQVAAIGLSGQMHGSVFLDAKNRPIRRALLWNDQRTEKQCADITRRAGGQKKLIGFVNNVALPGFTAPKILWLRDNEPNNYKKVRQILLPKDYVRFLLTGEFATEVSDAAGTLLLDVKRRKWSKGLLNRLEIDPALLPRVYESPEVTGTLTPEAASALGLTPGTPVVGGGGDQAAAAVGMGIVKQGLVSATIGTSGVVFAHAESVVPNPEGLLQSFCHAVPGKWCVFGCMLSAGGSLDWARDVLYKGERRKDLYGLIESEAKGSVAGSRGLIFLPYLEGERCPHPDPNARGCWIGLTRLHTRGDMARAVMEGITLGMADQIKMMRDLGVTINQVRCGGGGARSSFWLQLQADVYDARTVTVDTVDASAYGVAILAGVGAGVWKTVEQASKECVNIESTNRPTKRAVNTYKNVHATYRELYPTLQHSFRKLADAAAE